MIVAKIPPAREEDDAVDSGATSEAMEKILLKRTPDDDPKSPDLPTGKTLARW
jgi:hypothetical protein